MSHATDKVAPRLLCFPGHAIKELLIEEEGFGIEAVQTEMDRALREAVIQWFTLPTVRFIGAHTGCSCGFPSVIAAKRCRRSSPQALET